MRATRTWRLVVPALVAAGCLGTEHTGNGAGTPIGPSVRPGTGWICNDSAHGNGVCDCGCGESDPDCNGGGCTTPGCSDDACEVCWDGGDASPCASPDDLAANWVCDPVLVGDGPCDCGCGASDPDCDGGGCISFGCRSAACDHCWNGMSWEKCGYSSRSSPPRWICADDFYAEGDGDCDCGCGGDDPDCHGAGCATPGCQAYGCDSCWGSESAPYCTSSNGPSVLPEGWVCVDDFYGDGGCDCGCGAEDADCGDGDGCTTPGCWAEGCEFSW